MDIKLNSLTTPSVIHKRPECYLAELVMVNKHGTLPENFWRLERYKKAYIACLQLIKKRLDNCEYKYIYNAIVNNKVIKLDASFDEFIFKELLNES